MLTANVVEGAMGKLIERRENGRFRCKKDALHNTDADDLFFRGEVRNYSKRGMYFESNVDLQRGDNISILVEKQSTEGTQLVDVKIVWRKELQGLSFDRGYGAILQRRRDIDYIKNKLQRERHYDK
jgi:hypothetical protein